MNVRSQHGLAAMLLALVSITSTPVAASPSQEVDGRALLLDFGMPMVGDVVAQGSEDRDGCRFEGISGIITGGPGMRGKTVTIDMRVDDGCQLRVMEASVTSNADGAQAAVYPDDGFTAAVSDSMRSIPTPQPPEVDGGGTTRWSGAITNGFTPRCIFQ